MDHVWKVVMVGGAVHRVKSRVCVISDDRDLTIEIKPKPDMTTSWRAVALFPAGRWVSAIDTDAEVPTPVLGNANPG